MLPFKSLKIFIALENTRKFVLILYNNVYIQLYIYKISIISEDVLQYPKIPFNLFRKAINSRDQINLVKSLNILQYNI